MSESITTQQFTNALNKALQSMPEYQQLFGGGPSWRYFPGDDGKRYFWTTEKVWSKKFNEEVYVSGIYKRTGKTTWEMIKRTECDTRKEAKDIARKRMQSVRKETTL